MEHEVDEPGDASYDAIDHGEIEDPSPEVVEIMRLQQVQAWEAAAEAMKHG